MAKLKRELTLTTATIMGIAVIVGAGIYSLIGAATATAGSGVWLSFLIASIVALFTGLSYAELASMFPQAGSSFLYVMRGLNNKLLGFSAGWLILFETVIGAAAIAMAFGNYLSSIIAFPVMLSAFGIILLFSIVNLIGIKESVSINNVLFTLEIGGLLTVIALGFSLGTAHPDLMEFQLTPVLAGAALVFFAMLGFEMIATESEEAKDAKHTIPNAMVLAIVICTVLYTLFAIAALMLVSPEILGASTAPVKDIVEPLLGEYSYIFSLLALASTGSTILICLITASRLSYGMAEGGVLPKFLANVNKKFRTPHYTVFLAFLISAAFLLIADMVIIAEVTNFAALLAFFLINLSVIILRVRQPKTKREVKIPFSIRNVPIPAVLGAVTSLGLIFMLSQEAIFYGMGVTVLGGLVHLLMPKN
jgi:APA family basic amino acid/polyamine antiporter